MRIKIGQKKGHFLREYFKKMEYARLNIINSLYDLVINYFKIFELEYTIKSLLACKNTIYED